MLNKNFFLWFLGILAVIVIVAGVWYRYFATPVSIYSSDNTASTVLTTRNQDYALGQVYQKEGQYDLALKYYQQALPEAQDTIQAAQIRYSIAIMTELLGNYKDSIAQLKAVAADTNVGVTLRAYAVQEIGLMHFVNYYNTAAREIIDTETFKDAPYDAFKRDTSHLEMAYIKLFEYAMSLYPLGNSAARIAYGYSNELITTFKGATTTAQGKALITLVEQNVRAADADFQRMKDISEDAFFLPELLMREGVALGNIALLGAADPKRVEPYFQSSLQYAASLGRKPGSFSAYNYAAFLAAQYGNTRTEDIKKLLASFRVGNDVEIPASVSGFYKSARTDSALATEKSKLVLLSKIDAAFKTYLISLGWKESDFK